MSLASKSKPNTTTETKATLGSPSAETKQVSKEICLSKSDLRVRIKKILSDQQKSLNAFQVQERSRLLCENVIAVLNNRSGLWASYRNMAHEPDLSALGARLPLIQFVFPQIDARSSSLAEFRKSVGAPRWVRSASGFMQLADDTSAPVAISEIAGFLVPSLGLDRHGRRLGQGLGFYDRALGKAEALAHQSFLKIGVCWSEALFPSGEFDSILQEHDVNMDIVITEKEILRI